MAEQIISTLSCIYLKKKEKVINLAGYPSPQAYELFIFASERENKNVYSHKRTIRKF